MAYLLTYFFLVSLDALASQFCKTYSAGELKALAKSNLTVLQVYQNTFQTADTDVLELGKCYTCFIEKSKIDYTFYRDDSKIDDSGPHVAEKK